MSQDYVSVQAFHRDKQYQTVVGNFTNSNFKEFGSFDFKDTTKVYEALADHTKNQTKKFFGLKNDAKGFKNMVSDFKQLYREYARLAQNKTYEGLSSSLRFGYELIKENPGLTTLQLLDKLAEKKAELKNSFNTLRQNSTEINNTADDLDNILTSKEAVKKSMAASLVQNYKKFAEKKKEGQVFKFKNNLLNAFFGSCVQMMGSAGEIMVLNALQQNILGPLGEITDAKIVGSKKIKNNKGEYTSKGDISFRLKVGDKTSEAIFGSIKFKKGKTKDFVAVKGTSLKQVPVSDKFKTDFTNLFLSINMNSDVELKFLTSLIVDYALIGVFNRPMYFITATPTEVFIDFFYEMYDAYAKSSSGSRPYIKKGSLKYSYVRGNSTLYKAIGEDDEERGKNFYKNVKYEGGRMEEKYSKPDGYMTESYAMQKTDITDLIVIGKLIR